MTLCSTEDLAEELVDLFHQHVSSDEAQASPVVTTCGLTAPASVFCVETIAGTRFLVTVTEDRLEVPT